MAGKIYKNSFKLNEAWGDGRRAAQTGALVGTNPFFCWSTCLSGMDRWF
jgi:hypothetical protein